MRISDWSSDVCSSDLVDAATAGRAAAKAAFYPDLSLKAFAGYQSIGLDTLFDGGSGIWGFGPSVHLPLFDAQRLKAGYHGATAELDAAVASYNQTVLNAVRDVADQLTLSQSQTRQLEQSRPEERRVGTARSTSCRPRCPPQ